VASPLRNHNLAGLRRRSSPPPSRPAFLRDRPGPHVIYSFGVPSLEEGSGSVALLEALQAGVAVVASECDGIPENVADGEEAMLVEPGSIDALQGALATVLGDAPSRSRLAERARAAYEERFSAPAFAAALGRAYFDLGVVPVR